MTQLEESFIEGVRNSDPELICPKCKRKVTIIAVSREDLYDITKSEACYYISCGHSVIVPDKE